MRKPNYSQDRAQRERDKAAKAQAKELKKQERKAADDVEASCQSRLIRLLRGSCSAPLASSSARRTGAGGGVRMKKSGGLDPAEH
jgi:hypothetical protein